MHTRAYFINDKFAILADLGNAAEYNQKTAAIRRGIAQSRIAVSKKGRSKGKHVLLERRMKHFIIQPMTTAIHDNFLNRMTAKNKIVAPPKFTKFSVSSKAVQRVVRG